MTKLLTAVIFFMTSPVWAQKPMPVIVSEVKTTRFSDRVEALGTLRANESVELTATVTETVTDIHFEDGQRVEAGDILVEMTNEEEHALIEQELSTVAEAKKQYDRMMTLAKRGAASESQLDQRRREYQTAKAKLRAIESKMKDHLIMAPFSGTVGLRNISIGALIEPGDVVTTLDDEHIMKLDFTVPAVYLASLREGLPIQAVSSAFPGRTFKGSVSGIDSRVDRVTRSITVRALLPNPEYLLKPGLLMSVELFVNARETVVIPEEALIPSGRNNAVLLVERTAEPPLAWRRPVSIGGRRPGEVEILDGLKGGELVVTHGNMRAQDGQPVTIIALDSGNQPLAALLNQQVEDTE
jgi:membrane fusion protein (multidrug efflux system)